MKLHHYNEAYAHMVRRTPFANGSEKPTPRTFQDKLSTLKEASRGLDPESTLRLFDFYIQEALTKGELTEQQASGIYQSLPQAEIKETIETFERENFSEGGIDFSGLSVPQLRLLYRRYTGFDGPSDSRQLIRELKRLIKGLDEDGIPFSEGGRANLSNGTKLMDEYLGAQKEYQKAVDKGFQGTYEEFLRYKSSGSFQDGGRVAFREGTPIEDYPLEVQERIKEYGIKKYNKLNKNQKYDIRNPKRRTKEFNFKFKGKTIPIKGFGLKESSAKNIQDLLNILEKNPNITPEQWFAKTSKATKSAGAGLYQISQDLLKYVKGDFDAIKGATSKQTFDELNIKNLIKDQIPNLKNISGKAFRQSVATAARAKKAVTNTFEAVIRLNEEFKLDPDIELDELAEQLYGKGASKSVPLMNQTRNDVTRYIEVLKTGTRKNLNIPNFKYPSANQAANILDSIAEKSGDFGFQEGMIRDLKFNIRDDLLKLKKGTTKNLRSVLSDLIKGKGDVIDEAVGLSATFEDAPGYTEATQVIKNKYNKRKGFLIDKPFSALIKKLKTNSATTKEINDFNTISKRFMKETGVDSPIIKPGKNLNPEKFIKSFKDYSPEAQANIKQLAKENNFVIQTKSEPLKNVVSSLQKNRPLKDKVLSGIAKTGRVAGKVLKPLSYGVVGPIAVSTAVKAAEKQGLNLNLLDKAMAFESGDPEVAINMAKRRVDPEFAAQERAKDLAQMTDDFEEVGQSTFGKFNDQIKNIKLP